MLNVGFIKNEEAKLVGTHVSKYFKEMGFQDNESVDIYIILLYLEYRYVSTIIEMQQVVNFEVLVLN
jgi:hypothetical protein